MDGNQDTGESWKGNDALSCTNKLWDQFSMTATLESGNQVSNWFCHSNSRSYYNSPNGEIEPEYSKVFTLDSDRVPPYSKCGFWEYYNQENGSNLVASGDGCTTSNLTMPTSGWINVNFELCKGVWVDSEQCDTLCGPGKLIRTCQWSDSSCTGEPTCDPAILPTDCNPGVCHYTLVPTVRRILPEMELPGECPVNPTDWDDYNLLIGGNVKAQSSDGTYSVTLQTGDDGKVSFDVPYNYTQVVFSSDTDTGGVEPENYSLKCPTQNYVYPESAFDYLPSHTVPWNNGLGTYPSYNLNLGVQAIPKNGWFSAVDSDIFANDYLVVVPDGPTDNESEAQTPKGFAKSLINSSSNNDYSLGFLSSQADLIANPALDGCSDNKVFENNPDCDIDYGGYSVNLLSNGISHTSKWLESFTFSPPSEALDIGGDPMKLIKTSSPLVLNSGVFSAEHSVIEGILGPVGDITYSVDGSGLTIIYVNGDLNIDNKLTASSSTSGRLLLIVNGSVTVDSNVGTDEASFLMSQNPDIGAGIIASGSVVFPSINNERKTEENRDKPIMVSAPLISKNSISFSRDLYHDYNARIPAQSAKAFNKYLYLLTSLERQESQDNLYFTGVTTFDLDWEYIY